MVNSGIYSINDKIIGKAYIGSSINVYKRWHRHKWELNKGIHHNRFLQNAWNKHGEGNFDFGFIEQVPDRDKLMEREQCWLNVLSSTPIMRSTLFNCSTDVTGGNLFNRKQGVYTEERRKRMSELMKGNKFAVGKGHSPSKEIRDRIANTLRNRGGHLKGSKHGCAILTEDKVIEIRSKFKDGETRVKLATEYNVTKLHINSIVSRRYWKHI